VRKIRAFFYTFYKSITSIKYYKDVVDVPLSFSIKYFLVLAFLSTVIITVFVSATVTPKAEEFVGNTLAEIKRIYPDDLEIWVENNEWYINKEEPFVVQLPMSMRGAGIPTNLIVFDKEGTIDDFKNWDTFVLLNRANALIKGDNKMEVLPLDDLPEGKITRDNFDDLIVDIESLTEYAPHTIVFFTALITFIENFLLRAAYLAIIGLFLLLYGVFTKANIKFSNLYQISIHTMTLPLLIKVLSVLTSVSIPGPWFSIVNLVFGVIVVSALSKTKAQKVVTPTTPPTKTPPTAK